MTSQKKTLANISGCVQFHSFKIHMGTNTIVNCIKRHNACYHLRYATGPTLLHGMLQATT
jgi:hypothetical protein